MTATKTKTVRHRPDIAPRSCYVGGCRKTECVEANRAYQREWVAAKRAKAKV